VQRRLIEEIIQAKSGQRNAQYKLKQALARFSDVIDGRGEEELPEVDPAEENENGFVDK
jgi:type I restriction enzyme M protein